MNKFQKIEISIIALLTLHGTLPPNELQLKVCAQVNAAFSEYREVFWTLMHDKIIMRNHDNEITFHKSV